MAAIVIVVTLSLSAVWNLGSAAEKPRKLITGYLAFWNAAADSAVVPRLPAQRLTHIYFAFGEISRSGTVAIPDPCLVAGRCTKNRRPHTPGGVFAQLAHLKAAHPHLRLLISFGGWNGSKYFSKIAATTNARAHFARSVIDVFFKQLPGLFDGVDIDWEYPVSGGLATNLQSLKDAENFPKLMAEIRRRLDQLSTSNGRRYELVIAGSANPERIGDLMLARTLRSVDWINVMAYDYSVGGKLTGFNAPLFGADGDPKPHANVDATVKAYLSAGVPRGRLVLGLPFYGRAYGGVPNIKGGRFQSADTGSVPAWGTSNVFTFKELVARRPMIHGFRRYWDSKRKVPWLYSPTRRIWITYEDAQSIAQKAAFVRSQKLGGVAIWELSADSGMLFRALVNELYPNSVQEDR